MAMAMCGFRAVKAHKKARVTDSPSTSMAQEARLQCARISTTNRDAIIIVQYGRLDLGV